MSQPPDSRDPSSPDKPPQGQPALQMSRQQAPQPEAPQGTLQELFPALAQPTPSLPLEPIHARVLEVQEAEGAALFLTCWRNPGGAPSLHAGLRPRVEAALLSELCRPVAEVAAAGRELRYLRVSLFEDVGGDLSAALRAFGLRELPMAEVRDAAGWREAFAHLRGEAQRTGHRIPDEPQRAFEADILLPGQSAGVRAPLTEQVMALELALRERMGDAVFGQRPGAFYALLVKLAAEHLSVPLPSEPTCDYLSTLEAVLVQLRPGPIRWLPPAIFQCLCDVLAVIAAREFQKRVEWAPSDPDEYGLCPPPMVRVHLDGEWVHIPLGAHLLRWCVMPLQPGEVVPPLSDWVLDQFGKR